MHEGQLAVSVGVVRRLVAGQFPVEAEAAAGRELAGRTPFATPEPVALGEPGAGYPLPWSVQTWLPGVTAHPG
jgi:aminoglycoside phosphotransferase (APT) family kinase protein